jgi:hypothetical protein
MKIKLLLLVFFVSLQTGFAQWQQTSGSSGMNVYAIEINGGFILAGTGSGVLKSSDNGISCNPANNGLTSTNVRAMATIGSYTFAGTFWGGGVFLSTDYGTSWTSVNNGLTNTFILALGEKNTDLFAGSSSGGIFISSDYGTTWAPATTGMTAMYTYALVKNGTEMFAGTEGGVFLSTNNGVNWTTSSNGIPLNSTVATIAVKGAKIFAGTYENGIFVSSDNGSSWTQVNTGLSTTDVRSFVVNGTVIYAGTNGGGVFLSTNDGANWEPVNSGLTNLNVYSLSTDGTTIFSGTGDGVWKRPIAEVNGISELNMKNNVRIFLDPSTKKLFITNNNIQSNGLNSTIQLEIINILGQQVMQQLIVDNKSEIDLNGFVNGIYMVKLHKGSNYIVKKIDLD